MPENLSGEVLAAVVLSLGFRELSPQRRRSAPVQDLMTEEAPRIGSAMATWVSWLDSLSAERRQALEDHLDQSPETLDLAGEFVFEKTAVAGLDLDLERQLKRARRILRRRSIRWGLETLLRRATEEAVDLGLKAEDWRSGGFRQDPVTARKGPEGGPPPARTRGRAPMPPVIAWGLRLLGLGVVFLAAGWVLGLGGAPAVGVLLTLVGVFWLIVGFFVLFWGLIAIGSGFHMPPPKRRRRQPPPGRPPPR